MYTELYQKSRQSPNDSVYTEKYIASVYRLIHHKVSLRAFNVHIRKAERLLRLIFREFILVCNVRVGQAPSRAQEPCPQDESRLDLGKPTPFIGHERVLACPFFLS
jgi:hypothetical protein